LVKFPRRHLTIERLLAVYDDRQPIVPYGNASLSDIQLFSVSTLQQTVALVRADRSPKVAKAMQLFADLQPQLTEAGTLNNPTIRTSLQHILELAPNHLSAKYLLAVSDDTAPRYLSRGATIAELDALKNPYPRRITRIESPPPIPTSDHAATAPHRSTLSMPTDGIRRGDRMPLRHRALRAARGKRNRRFFSCKSGLR
jgi:hypothetical protein